MNGRRAKRRFRSGEAKAEEAIPRRGHRHQCGVAQPQARCCPAAPRPTARSVTFARTNGVLQELRVRRGSHVKKGDIIAILSDDAREAQVLQAKAMVDQRRVELEAKRELLLTSAMPRLDLD